MLWFSPLKTYENAWFTADQGGSWWATSYAGGGCEMPCAQGNSTRASAWRSWKYRAWKTCRVFHQQGSSTMNYYEIMTDKVLPMHDYLSWQFCCGRLKNDLGAATFDEELQKQRQQLDCTQYALWNQNSWSHALTWLFPPSCSRQMKKRRKALQKGGAEQARNSLFQGGCH